MVWWVDGWGHVKSQKNRINLGLIEIIQFCLKSYDLWIDPHLWVVVCVTVGKDGLMGWGQVESLRIE